MSTYIYDVRITRAYRLRAASYDDAVLEALRLESTEASEWPGDIEACRRARMCKHDDGACNEDDPCDYCPIYSKNEEVPNSKERS